MRPAPVTFITGGSSGIGAAVARQLLERGHRVAVTARRPDRLDRFADGLGRPAELLTIASDATDYKAVEAAVESAVTAFGRLDNAVANAGFAVAGDFPDGDPDEWRDMVLTNVLGPALLVKAALPALKRTGGRIVFVGSVAGLIHTPGNLYGATKWAVTGLAENTRPQVTGDGVGVTLFIPGATDTNFFDRVGREDRPGGYMAPDQMADAMVWALSQPPGVDVNTVTVRPLGSPR